MGSENRRFSYPAAFPSLTIPLAKHGEGKCEEKRRTLISNSHPKAEKEMKRGKGERGANA